MDEERIPAQAENVEWWKQFNALLGEHSKATENRDVKALYRIREELHAHVKQSGAFQLMTDFEEMYALYMRDEERGDPELRDMRFAGYAAAFFTRFLRMMNPDWK